jgi:WS/DGAT/MGAT family acyltransferase
MTSERIAPVDTTWLRMDRPTNPMVIVGVLVLAPPLDVTRVEAVLAERLLAIRRFRECAETGATGAWWNEDPHFDITRHVRRVRLPGAGDKAELERFVAEQVTTPLDPRHPLWQFHIVEDFEGGAALVARIHHAIGDGMALIRVLLSLMDGHADAMEPSGPAEPHEASIGPVAPLMSALSEGLKLSSDIWLAYLKALSNPAQALRDGTGIAAELAYLLLMPNDSPTRFKGKPSGNKRVAWTDPIDLPEVKAVSGALGCSINDMLLASVAGALNGYLAAKGDPTEGVNIRALVPVNLRRADERSLGNRFGVVALELPVGIGNPLARLYEVHRRMEALKTSYEPAVTLGLLTALGYAPQLVQDAVFNLLLSRASAVMTNVPGPQQPLFLAGSLLKQVMFWVPQAGDIGLGVSILSFNGQVQFGLMADAALVPDPQAIVARFKPEFEQLLYFVLLETTPEPSEVAAAEASRKRVPRRRAKRVTPAG